jgi:hypothetical protein
MTDTDEGFFVKGSLEDVYNRAEAAITSIAS